MRRRLLNLATIVSLIVQFRARERLGAKLLAMGSVRLTLAR